MYELLYFFLLSIMFLKFIQVVACNSIHSFLWLNNIPLYVYTTICSFIFWWTFELFLLNCYEQHYFVWVSVFSSFQYIPKSGIERNMVILCSTFLFTVPGVEHCVLGKNSTTEHHHYSLYLNFEEPPIFHSWTVLYPYQQCTAVPIFHGTC
jgi:hypothetical protein